MRRWLYALAGLAVLAGAGLVAASTIHERGYLSPQFSADGSSVVVVVRDTRAVVLGFGYEMFTPPARTRILRDRFSIVRITLADRRQETLVELPASPLEGGWVHSYRPSLTGSVSAHLRWATPEALEFEVAVSRPRQPTSETFVTRRRWNPGTASFELAAWMPGSTSMGGDEKTQLHGDREVIVRRAGGAMPCAVLIVTAGQPLASPLAEEGACRQAYPGGYPVTDLTEAIRRPDIERSELLKTTHERLVAEARAKGMGEGDAALAAIRGMQRQGLYPKPSTIVATPAGEPDSGAPVFEIARMEFVVGLFPDIEQAIQSPGVEVEKSIGEYISHDDYDTSRRINEFLARRSTSTFFVRTDGRLWKIVVTRR
jgi:hypothetical protein